MKIQISESKASASKLENDTNSSQTEGSRTKLNNKILVSEVKIEFIKPQDGIIAFASVVINGAICLSSIAIHKKLNTEGYRITYPSNGKFNIFHPINKETGSAIEQAILNKLNEVMSKVVYETKFGDSQNHTHI